MRRDCPTSHPHSLSLRRSKRPGSCPAISTSTNANAAFHARATGVDNDAYEPHWADELWRGYYLQQQQLDQNAAFTGIEAAGAAGPALGFSYSGQPGVLFDSAAGLPYGYSTYNAGRYGGGAEGLDSRFMSGGGVFREAPAPVLSPLVFVRGV